MDKCQRVHRATAKVEWLENFEFTGDQLVLRFHQGEVVSESLGGAGVSDVGLILRTCPSGTKCFSEANDREGYFRRRL